MIDLSGLTSGGYGDDRPIPRILHTRCQLNYYRCEFENGAQCIFLSSHTYPELFNLRFPLIFNLNPKGWLQKPDRTYQKYLYIPPGKLDNSSAKQIDSWGDRFRTYVLLGFNSNIEKFFRDKLDFCLAISFNKPEPGAKRTDIGEAVYQLKYQSHLLSSDNRRMYARILLNGILQGFDDLPLPTYDVLVSGIPSSYDGKNKIAWKIAEATARDRDCEFLSATLKCSKRSLKGLLIGEKAAEWKKLFGTDGCIELSQDPSGRTIVVVDDLYQSGITMWHYANYLKLKGARHVIGISCVKSLKDTDNL